MDYLKMNFSPYDLRGGNALHLPPTYSTCHEINSLLFRRHEALPCPCVVCK